MAATASHPSVHPVCEHCGMSVAARALALRRVSGQSPAARLLASPHAPVILAIVAEHFEDGARRRPVVEIYELMVQDFRALRGEFEMPRKPQEYVNEWVRSGWFVRSAGTAQSGELLEPSEDALYARDVFARWEAPHSAATASRIESISASLQALARDTDPDISSRLARLTRERDELERRIEQVSRGEFDLLTESQVKERVTDILDSAAGVPADFARVRHELEELNRSLRRQLLDPEGTRGDVLREIFNGVDLISDSAAGRSFNGFYAVLMDQERSAFLDDWISSILARPEAKALSTEERGRVRRLFRDMEDGGADVNLMITNLARSLRHYVTSEQFNEDRRMVELLRETRSLAAKAAAATDLSPIHRMTTPLVRIGMPVHSVSALRLKNPGEEIVEDAPTAISPETADLDSLLELVRESEIDMEELIGAVSASVDKHGTATVSTVLGDHPATQGLASVVGLLYLGLRHGQPTSRPETVTWSEEYPDDPARPEYNRTARIPGWFFDATAVEEM